MMKLLVAVAVAIGALSTLASAQEFTWEGEVDGTLVLHVHGKTLDVECQKGQPVQRQRFRFNRPLAESRQPVRLEVRQGRGSVSIIQQPRLDNSYSVDVSIEDRQDGASFYSIALYWAATEGEHGPGRRDHVTWSGVVDGEAIVECRARQCVSTVQSGHLVRREHSKFTRPMPAADVPMTLDETNGPAEIRLVQMPATANNYAARVSVQGAAGGGDCSFTLSWERPQPARSRTK